MLSKQVALGNIAVDRLLAHKSAVPTMIRFCRTNHGGTAHERKEALSAATESQNIAAGDAGVSHGGRIQASSKVGPGEKRVQFALCLGERIA